MKYLTEFAEALSLGMPGSVDSVIIAGVLNSMSDGLMVMGAQGDVLYANKAVQEILGFSLQDFREKGLEDLVSGNHENHDFNEIFADIVEKRCAGGYREVTYLHPSGNLKRLAATTSYLLADGRHESILVGFVLLFKDVTEVFNLRVKEQDLLREKQRVEQEKARSLHRLAMGVAHEIRNPVVTIGGFAARIMRDHMNREDTRHQAERIFQDAGRLERLVDQVQQYCDLPEFKATEGDISLTVEDAVGAVTARAQVKSITLEIVNNLDGRRCVFDPILMGRALVELLDNAVDFSPQGARVLVFLLRREEETVVEVTDSGVGIEPEYLEYLFDPFFSTRTESSGMGLAIVDRIVQEHMGRINVDSEPGRGTTIRITLSNCLLRMSS